MNALAFPALIMLALVAVVLIATCARMNDPDPMSNPNTQPDEHEEGT